MTPEETEQYLETGELPSTSSVGWSPTIHAAAAHCHLFAHERIG